MLKLQQTKQKKIEREIRQNCLLTEQIECRTGNPIQVVGSSAPYSQAELPHAFEIPGPSPLGMAAVKSWSITQIYAAVEMNTTVPIV